MVKKVAIFILVCLLLGGVLGYLLFNKLILNKTPAKSPPPGPTKVIRPIPFQRGQTVENTNKTQTTAAIKQAFQNKPYSAKISAYYDPRGVVIGPYGMDREERKSFPKQVDQELDKFFEQATGPWNFESDNPTTQKLVTTDPANFEGAIVGISPDRYAVVFTLNSESMIEKIILVPDWKIVLP